MRIRTCIFSSLVLYFIMLYWTLNIRGILLCSYEFQMQYGSIGWSVGATLGYAQAAQGKRVIACIGDGSFQVCIYICLAAETITIKFRI